MRRTYSKGFVVKHRNKWWRAIISWQGVDGKQHRKDKADGGPLLPRQSRRGNRGNNARQQGQVASGDCLAAVEG